MQIATICLNHYVHIRYIPYGLRYCGGITYYRYRRRTRTDTNYTVIFGGIQILP